MGKEYKWKLLFIFILALFATYIIIPIANKPLFQKGEMFENIKINKGLDLQGGARIIIDLKNFTGNKDAALTKTIDILSTRIDNFGLKEPVVRKKEDQIEIQLPGKNQDEIDKVINIIKTTGKLEFKIVAPNKVLDIIKPGTSKPNYRWYKNLKGEDILVEDKVLYGGDNIKNARVDFKFDTGEYYISFENTLRGSSKFEALTKKYKKRKLAIILDDKVISAPVIQGVIKEKGEITGSFTNTEARKISNVLNSGSLPGDPVIVGQSYVGPTLGERAIKMGLYACLFALACIIIFMLIYYMGGGIISILALGLNMALILGTLSFFGATLTLPGIAGIILTMGMAVDANIIVFERIREELDKGKLIQQAFETGFNKAYSAVIDANITTFLIALVLYYFGTGAIKGFAVTLSIGIITTLFTAIFCTKTFMQFAIHEGLMKKFSMLRILNKPNFNFINKGKLAITLSIIIMVIGLSFTVINGKKDLGIDFKGGTSVTVNLKNSLPTDEIRTKIMEIKDANNNAKYADSELQTVEDVNSKTQKGYTNEFILRTTSQKRDELVDDIRTVFAENITNRPFIDLGSIDKPNNPYHGGKMIKINLSSPIELMKIQTEMKELFKEDELKFFVKGVEETKKEKINPKDNTKTELYSSYVLYLTSADTENSRVNFIKDEIRGKFNLSKDAFEGLSYIGPSVAKKLIDKAIIAVILSWICIIIYIAFRFQFKYGLAAVAALIHDVLITVGIVSFMNWAIPSSLEFRIDMTMATVAALLTIIGYSVNDTIVLFDRIRENLVEQKHKPLPKLSNLSINQTLSRTILTSLTVFFAVVILSVFSLKTGSGIANFAVPMIIGVVVGTYSSVYIATPVLLFLTKKFKN